MQTHFAKEELESIEIKFLYKLKGVKNSSQTCYASCIIHIICSVVIDINHLIPINPVTDIEKETYAILSVGEKCLRDYHGNNIKYINNFRLRLL